VAPRRSAARGPFDEARRARGLEQAAIEGFSGTSGQGTRGTRDIKARTLGRRLLSLVEGCDRSALRAARRYVATDEESGRRQLALLKREGCLPSSRVLEVGCGALHAGNPTIEYLEPGKWVGIEPNGWLIDAALTNPGNRRLVESKRACFLNVDDFDASSLGRSFDYVLSHSVLSHAAHWQLPLFLHNVGKVLAPSGRIVASFRLAEGTCMEAVDLQMETTP